MSESAGVPKGPSYAGAMFGEVSSGDITGLSLSARTSAPAPSGAGRFGLFYPAVAQGLASANSAWVFGLQQDPTIDLTWRSSTPVRPMKARTFSASNCSMGAPGGELILSRESMSKQKALRNTVRSCRSIHQHPKMDTCALHVSEETTRLLLTESSTTEVHPDTGQAMALFYQVFRDPLRADEPTSGKSQPADTGGN